MAICRDGAQKWRKVGLGGLNVQKDDGGRARERCWVSRLCVAITVKLHNKNQMISKNFYVRGDNTCSFYFSEEFLSTLFMTAGFKPVDMSTYCKRIENRARDITMNRRWVRAIFRSVNHGVPLES